MKKKILITAACLAAVCIAALSYLYLFSSRPVRIACVGDSITWGAYLEKRSRECYPARLQQYLGKTFLVKNFGVNSATVQKSGDKPYWEQDAFLNSAAFAPDVVFLMLGTNDTKTQNRQGLSQFRQDYTDMIDYYLSLSSHPRVYILTPPPIFSLEGDGTVRFAMHPDTLLQEITVMKEVAAEKKLPVIDIYRKLSGQSQYFTLDGVHPDREGADVIAQTVYRNFK
ncbi:MAG: GDSL-type esterase/lipase family protein [Ruminococcus sp.]|jgi:acyl-CoA thioesterase-1